MAALEKEIKGLPLTILTLLGGLIILLLVIIPIYTLLIGYNGNVGVLMQIINGVDYTGNSSLADSSVLISIITSIVAIIVILLIVINPTDYLRSGIYVSLMHITNSVASITKTKNLKDDDPEQYNSLRLKIGTYSMVLLVIFVMYFSIIISLTQEVASGQGTSMMYILGMLTKGLVIIGLNTVVLNMLDSKDPAPVWKGKKLIWTEEQKTIIDGLGDNRNGIVVGFALLVVNIAALGISAQISDFTVNQLQNTGYSDVIEGQGGNSLNNLLNN